MSITTTDRRSATLTITTTKTFAVSFLSCLLCWRSFVKQKIIYSIGLNFRALWIRLVFGIGIEGRNARLHIYGVSKSVTFIPGLLLTHTLKICTGTYDGEGMKLGIIHWSTTVHVQDRVQSTVKSIALFGEAPNAVHYIYGGEI